MSRRRKNRNFPEIVPETIPEGEPLCPLCSRVLAQPANRHHLIPLSRGGKGTTTVLMHKICHDKIHSVLTEAELKRSYHTIEALQQQPEIATFIRWVSSRPPEFYDRSVRRKR